MRCGDDYKQVGRLEDIVWPSSKYSWKYANTCRDHQFNRQDSNFMPMDYNSCVLLLS